MYNVTGIRNDSVLYWLYSYPWQTFLWNVDASFAPFGDSLQQKSNEERKKMRNC